MNARIRRVFPRDEVAHLWAHKAQDGAGPMVGHYRVNNIGADGSLIIGCHEFSPAEARRLYDVLTSCPACAEVAA